MASPETRRAKYINDLRSFVAIRSVSEFPQDRTPFHVREIDRAIDFVVERVRGMEGFTVREYVRNGSRSLVIGTEDTLTPDIGLLGHLDVVAGPDEIFDLRVEGDRAFGRGAKDMKSGVLNFLDVLPHLPKGPDAPSVALILTTDEEKGSDNGAKYLAEEVGLRPGILFVPDAAASDNWNIVEKANGALHVQVDFHGVQGHASRPWEGVNAADQKWRFQASLRRKFPEILEPDLDATSLNFSYGDEGQGEGRRSGNSVASDAMTYMDWRFSKPGEKERIIKAIKRRLPSGATIIYPAEAYLSLVDVNDPRVKLFTDLLTEVTGEPVIPSHESGATDARFFTQYGIPAVVLSAPSGLSHNDGEWTSSQGNLDYQDALARYLTSPQVRRGR